MGSILLKDTAGTVTVLLTLQSGGPALGLSYAAVAVALKKAGQSSFTTLTLDNTTFVEIGDGVYDVKLGAADTNVVGNFTLKFSGTVVNNQLVTGYVTSALPVNPTSIVLPSNRTGLFGYLKDIHGDPISNADVFARVVGMPVHDTTTGYSISSMDTKTDENGFFFITLVTSLTVNITIPAINYSRTLVVPGSNANLFGIV